VHSATQTQRVTVQAAPRPSPKQGLGAWTNKKARLKIKDKSRAHVFDIADHPSTAI
jgi:hypothetical protein